MRHLGMRLTVLMTAALVLLSIGGCRQGSPSDGIHVMFENHPHINGEAVYWHGQAIGRIRQIQVGHNAITRVTVVLDSAFRSTAGRNWAFYVDRGRLMTDRLSISGDSVSNGAALCGFSSRAALKWFKFKTLLRDRVAKANRRAETLHRRFG